MYISYWVSKQALDTEIYDSNIYNMRNQANYEKLECKRILLHFILRQALFTNKPNPFKLLVKNRQIIFSIS